MADQSLDPLAQLQQHEQEDQQQLQKLQGEHAVTQEQVGYQSQIDNQPRHVNVNVIKPDTNTAFGDVVRDVGHRVAQIPEGLAAGPIRAFGEMEASVAELAGAKDYADQIRYELTSGDLTAKTDTGLGQAAAGITQFMTYFLPANEAIGASTMLGKVATVAGAGGAAQAMAFNPHDERLSNLVQSVPALKNPVTNYLQSQPGDTEADGLLKNGLEGLVTGGLTETAMNGFTAVLRAMRATGGIADATKALSDAKSTPVESVPPAAPAANEPVFAHDVTHEEGAVGDHQFSVEGKGKLTAQETTYNGADALQVQRADSSVTGQGVGSSMYQAAADHALGKNMPLVSDVSVSPAAAQRWDALERQGYTVERNGASINPETGNFVSSEPGKPVFAATKAPAEPQPYVPSALAKADTAAPVAAHVEPTPGVAEQPKVFDPTEIARNAIKITPENAKNVLGSITDGRYSDIPAMLDDTHRTIPWESLSDGANLKGLFNAFESNFGAMIKAAHGTGPVTSDTIIQLAKDIGASPGAIGKLYTDTTAQGGLAARITAGYNIMVASGRQLQDLAKAAHALNPDTPAGAQAVLDFQKQLELHAAVVGQVRQSSAEIGRALYAHRALKASSDVALNNINDLAGTVVGPAGIKKFLKSVANGEDLSSLNAAVDATRGKGFLGIAKELAQGGMLSSLGTQVKNLAGNVSGLIVRAIEPYIAATIGNVRGVFMPSAETMTYRAALAHTAGIVDGVKDSFPLFVKALSGIDPDAVSKAMKGGSSFREALKAGSVGEPKTTLSGAPIIRAIYKDTTGLTGVNLSLAQVYNRVGVAIRYPGRLMGAIDNLNRGIGYQSDLSARTYTQAATEADAKGLSGPARDTFLGKRIADLKENPPPDVQEKSADAGLYQSFQEAARTGTGEKIASALNSHPLVKLLIAPFTHRPMNMLRQTLVDYNPLLAGLNPKVRADIMGGTMDTDTALARLAVGSAGMAWAYHMAESGQLTGPRMGYNNTQSLDGVPPWSMKVGDRYFRYDSVDPIGMWLAIGAGTHEAIQRHYDPNDQDTVNQLAGIVRVGAQVMGQAAIDKSFMKSMDEVMTAFGEKDPNRMDLLMQRLVNENATKFIPFSGFMRSVAQSLDPFRKDSSGPVSDALKANFPILSKDVPNRMDILGRPIAIPSGNTSWFNPFGGAPASPDPLNQKLAALAVGIRPPPRSINGLTLDQTAHDEIVHTATQTPMFSGNTLEQELRAVSESDRWKAYDHTDDNGVAAHTLLAQGLIDQAYDYGKQKFAVDHKDFMQAGIKKITDNAKHYQPIETPQQ